MAIKTIPGSPHPIDIEMQWLAQVIDMSMKTYFGEGTIKLSGNRLRIVPTDPSSQFWT